MATEHRQQVERLVRAALEHPPSERNAFLDGACLDDASLRKEVEALLASRERSASSPQESHTTSVTALRQDASSLEGRKMGHYKLLQKIGEGGMGIVYEAEQQEPVRRKVALKLIKWGMDTKQVIARFESERQALALMNHPNIAAVYDAAATSGRLRPPP